MTTTRETRTVKNHFDRICASIPTSGVTTFANELLEADLICIAGHSAAIDVGGLPPDIKTSKLVSEVMTKVAGSQDKFVKFVSLLKSRNQNSDKCLPRAG